MLNFELTIIACLSFLSAVFAVYKFKNFANQVGILDHPNYRSSHNIATPIGAGIVIAALWAILWLMICFFYSYEKKYFLIIGLGAIILTCLGYYDDLYKLKNRTRFILQVIVASLTLYFLSNDFQSINLGVYNLSLSPWLLILSSLLIILWSINLFNFMDGTDGLAVSQAIFVLSLQSYLFWSSNNFGLAIFTASILPFLCGFLVWNFPPAKIFMGDAGSYLLGFLTAVLAIIAYVHCDIPILLWAIIYSPFWIDATFTLLRRIVRKECWYEAHKSHAYQRLQKVGWDHKKILLNLTGINIVLWTIAFVAYCFPEYLIMFFIATVILLTVIYYKIELISPME